MCYKPNTHPHKATLFHILNHSESFLGENERIKWCHDSVLNFMTLTLKENKPSRIHSSSSPPTVYLFELNICFEPNTIKLIKTVKPVYCALNLPLCYKKTQKKILGGIPPFKKQ